MKDGDRFNPYSLWGGIHIPGAISTIPGTRLSTGAKMCFGLLVQHAEDDPNNPLIFLPSYSALSEEMGETPKSIYGYINELVSIGLIGVEGRSITFNWTEEVEGSVIIKDTVEK
jgi:hypothetical protein